MMINLNRKCFGTNPNYFYLTSIYLKAKKIQNKNLQYLMLQKEIWVKENKQPVNTQEGQTIVEQIRALSFLECSAKTQDGIRKVFEINIRATIQVRKKRKLRKCDLKFIYSIFWTFFNNRNYVCVKAGTYIYLIYTSLENQL